MPTIMPYNGKQPKIHKNVFVAPNATVIGDVEIGEGSSLWFNTVVRGDFQPIRIGKYTNVQDNCTIHVMMDASTNIGDNVLIGRNAILHCAHIGSNCLIGMGSIILGYSEIGDNVILGAGTLLTQRKKIPSNSLVFGNPAEIVRALRDDEIQAVKESALHYHTVAEKYKAELL